MSNETPRIPAVGDRVRILEIVAELYTSPEMPSPGIVSDMVAMVGKEFPVTKVEDSKYGTLFQVDEWVFLREWIEVVPPGEGKEGAGSGELFPVGTEKLLGSILGPLEDYEGQLGQDRPNCVVNAEVVIGQILADKACMRAPAGPRPSSSQPLARAADFRAGYDAGYDDGADRGQSFQSVKGRDPDTAWAEYLTEISPSPESLGGRLIVRSPDAEVQK
jgi:hypothetical protein